ncbi:MAG TPA: O-antigen ligase family protein [Burkholderiales bacterium]|jgi:O-antigen ligase|nr:O-antigen ligase family protein [Burkholderiales bacterium]
MMPKFWREWQRPVELSLLLAFVFFLPLREAPKNIFWALYVITWVVNRVRARDFGGRWDNWDTLSLLWIVAGYLAAIFAGIHRGDGNEVAAVNDLVKYVSLLWCLRRARYTRNEALTLLAALVASCVLAEVEALWNWLVVHKRHALELKSVGQVNHSAIYMTICFGIDVALTLVYWRALERRWRALLVAGGLLMLIGLFLTGSRAAAGAAILLICMLAFLCARLLGLGRAAWAGALLVVAAGLLIGGTKSLQRQIENTEENNMLTERDLIWNRGLVAWRASPWFGLGPDNYSQITERDLRTQLALEGKPYNPREYAAAPHAHNLYINQLVERGIVGLTALLAVLGAWGLALWRYRPRTGIDAAEMVLWCASFSGWMVTVLIGMVNTTLHHEHALLALMTLGLWLPLARAQSRATQGADRTLHAGEALAAGR